ncbi:MAG TPA: sulfatase-like hydrolase/transferase [Bacteroidales bacterium]|nr:sulfatase-like hydrolase/transferase [Bacteroidales bacterium]
MFNLNCTSYERIIILFSLVLSFSWSDLSSQPSRPNIIYIMTDDMGYGDLSGYGRKDYQTTHLDDLAKQGVKFINAYSAGPLCTPTRTAFMTGRYPARTPVGLLEPLTSSEKDREYGLTADYPSIASLLKSGGYQTALVGKWHLGVLPQHSPLKNGFDYFFGIRTGAADYISHKGDNGNPDLYENDQLVEMDGYLTELFTQKAISFIKGKHDKPFFLVITYNAPHWPWQGPDARPYPDSVDFRDGGSPEIYAQMMKSLDEGVGNIIKALDGELSGRTLVIFTNDNGGERFSDNAGLMKSKGTLWEGGIKVPAFARWTGTIKAGGVSEQVIVTMDWTATILSAAGVQPPPDFPFDGMDLMPVMISPGKVIDRTLYWRTFQRTRQKAIRSGEWKYIQDEKGEYLFNLFDDPGEKSDLKAAKPEIFNQLKSKYENWEKTVLQPIAL